ncbi:MAG: TfoX family protein [Alphaproteobacteria bacterium]|nr:MAG: TfoX family protein [Alphaproteobacteria bacterium]
MPLHDEFSEFLLDQLEPFGEVSLHRFFGGRSLKHDGLQFAMIIKDTLYFCVDDQTRPEFEARGMPHFSYEKGGKTIPVRKYHEVPADVLDDGDELVAWARAAYGAAVRAAK